MLKLFAFCTDYSILKSSFASYVKPIETPKPLSIKEQDRDGNKYYTDVQISSSFVIQKYYRQYLFKKLRNIAKNVIGVQLYNYKIRKLKKELVTINKIGNKRICLISF